MQDAYQSARLRKLSVTIVDAVVCGAGPCRQLVDAGAKPGGFRAVVVVFSHLWIGRN
jgi:hypothetical protein